MTNSEVFEDLMNSWFTTRQLAGYALCFREYNTPYARPLWEGIAGTEFEAREYYRSLDDETLRFEACTILVNGGWTRRSLALKNS